MGRKRKDPRDTRVSCVADTPVQHSERPTKQPTKQLAFDFDIKIEAGALVPAPTEAGHLADALGFLKAKVAALTEEEAKMKSELHNLLGGKGECEGALFRATASTFDKHTTDWKAIAEAVGFSPQMKAAHTKTAQDQHSVRVVAKTRKA
jgi:hypothetical protein